jgi:hypothetical protein
MNIANILKNCPEGIELYSSVCGEVIFIRVCSNNTITVRESNGSLRYFLPDGKYTGNGECVLFPSKEQRDWNKFIPDFKDGDIIITDLGNIAVFKDYKGIDPNRMRIYCQVDAIGKFIPCEMNVVREGWRLAEYSEIVAFEKKIAEAGYSWNGKELQLELHHVDGNRNNHSLDNLMLLCPNCHSQTDTFRARNIK